MRRPSGGDVYRRDRRSRYSIPPMKIPTRAPRLFSLEKGRVPDFLRPLQPVQLRVPAGKWRVVLHGVGAYLLEYPMDHSTGRILEGSLERVETELMLSDPPPVVWLKTHAHGLRRSPANDD